MRPLRIRTSIAWLIPLLLLFVVWGVQSSTVLCEIYARSIYPIISVILSCISSLFSFSLGDVFVYGSLFGLVVYILLRGSKLGWKGVFRFLFIYLAYTYIWFYFAWGFNYFRADFYQRSHVRPMAYDSLRFDAFLTTYVDSLNCCYTTVDSFDSKTMEYSIKAGYSQFHARFGLLSPTEKAKPKTPLCPALSSSVGVLGYMEPFANEFILNPDLLPVQIPFCYAHEFAHFLGVGNEAEANLYGFLACRQSAFRFVRYSAYQALLPYVLSNAYQILDKPSYLKFVKCIRPEVIADYKAKIAYWDGLYSPLIGKVQDVIYNFYLQSNNISSGTKNYSQVIALLIALESEKG